MDSYVLPENGAGPRPCNDMWPHDNHNLERGPVPEVEDLSKGSKCTPPQGSRSKIPLHLALPVILNYLPSNLRGS